MYIPCYCLIVVSISICFHKSPGVLMPDAIWDIGFVVPSIFDPSFLLLVACVFSLPAHKVCCSRNMVAPPVNQYPCRLIVHQTLIDALSQRTAWLRKGTICKDQHKKHIRDIPPPPCNLPPWRAMVSDGGGGGSHQVTVPPGRGDYTGVSRQTVVPSTDASKQSTGEATWVMQPQPRAFRVKHSHDPLE